MATSSSALGPVQMVASFDEAKSAREAMVALEGLGIDADAVHLLDQDDQVPVQAIDKSGELDAAQSVAGNYARGAVVLGVVVAVVAVLIVLVLGVKPRPLALPLAAIGGGIAGFVLGGYWNAARKLPVNVEALDTFTVDDSGDKSVRIQVRLNDPGMFDKSAAVCREHQATKVERATT